MEAWITSSEYCNIETLSGENANIQKIRFGGSKRHAVETPLDSSNVALRVTELAAVITATKR
jgi:hypothetical protein